MFDTRKFGANLSRLRKNADLTQSDLAEKIGVSRQSVSKYECGDSFPDVSVLVMAAAAFGVSVDELISGGEPTKAEAYIIKGEQDRVVNDVNVNELVNLAPLLRPSVLDKMTAGLAKQGIDITCVVELAKYLNDEATVKLLENATYDTIEPELLQKLIPFLDDRSRYVVFQKIIEGEMDYHFLSIVMPYAEHLLTQVEAAVVEGALDVDALRIVNEALAPKWEREQREIREAGAPI